MFTGIIEQIATVKELNKKGADLTIGITLATSFASSCQVGDSIALNGVCLTVVRQSGMDLFFDISSESLSKTTFKDLKIGKKLNLEQAILPTTRLGGHIVTGHVDEIGTISNLKKESNSHILEITLSLENMKYIVSKGSIAVDGISLTVAKKMDNKIEVAIIPHSYSATTLQFKKSGSLLNIEYDIIGKYVENFSRKESSLSDSKIDMEFLKLNRFLSL
ncbi:MAG: riboflavin synthase [Nitrospinota bacterium]